MGVDFFRCESILLKSYWVMVVMDVFTRRIIGWRRGGESRRYRHLRMFNRAIAKQPRRGASLQITIHCFAFIGGSRIFGA